MTLVPLSSLFEVRYGHSLELNRLQLLKPEAGGIPFVSRKMGDNGISAYIRRIDDVEPAPAGELSCALSGNGVLSTFVQDRPFYTAFHVACLRPLYGMSVDQLLYYCTSIRANRYRYSYGRQANKTLKDLLLPALDSLPGWVSQAKPDMFDGAAAPASPIEILSTLKPANWQIFRYDDLFEIRKGYYNKKPPLSTNESDVPFIGASENRNGITSFVSMHDLELYSRDGSMNAGESLDRKLFPGQCITVPNNGASVAEAFYQPRPFTCSHDVNPLYLKDKSVVLNSALGLFLATVIRAEKYRWSYGRKWRPMRMCDSDIKLPTTGCGTPDWAYMQAFIESLPFSSQITEFLGASQPFPLSASSRAMKTITKQSLPHTVHAALRNAGLSPNDFPEFPLQILQSGAIELDRDTPPESSSRYMELVITGGSSKQGTRTSGRHVNAFSLAAVVLSATSAQPAFSSFLALLVALFGACTVSLSPEQSAFFLAAKDLEKQNTIPTASALAASMGNFLKQPSYAAGSLLTVVAQLQSMGVQITVGAPPNQIIRHTEASIHFPLA